MRSKIVTLMLAVFLLVGSSAVLAADDKTAPRIYEGWDAAKGNMMTNFIDSVNFFKSPGLDESEDADTYGWYKGTFFGLAQWEKEICLADLSSEVRQQRDTITTHEEESQVYTTTITVSSIKTPSFNSSLYEVSWYLASYGEGDSGLAFRIYLEDDNNLKEYIVGKNDSSQGAFVRGSPSAAGYDVKYFTRDYKRVVLEYKFGENEPLQHFVARIVNAGEANNRTAAPSVGQPGTPPPPSSSPTKPANTTAPAGACPAPVTPRVSEIKLNKHGDSWDSTPIVKNNCAYCDSIGMGTINGQLRCSCPARPDGHPDRPACEAVMLGGSPRWFCNGNEIAPHGNNKFQASCTGVTKVCNADLSVCTEKRW